MEPSDSSIFMWQSTVWASRFGAPRLPQGLLLVGSSGHGRESFARALVRARLCSQPQADGQRCGVCQDCRWTAAGQHPDLHVVDPSADAEVDAAGEGRDDGEADRPAGRAKRWLIPVDAIRHASDALRLSSAGKGLRILLIEHADTMNAAAANALLKLLEEPPAAVSIVLSTGVPSRLPATVRSRCQVVRLPSASRDAALAWLRTTLPSPREAEERLDRAGGAPLVARDLDPDVVALQRSLDAVWDGLDSTAAAVAAAATIPEDRIVEAIDHLHRRLALALRHQLERTVPRHGGASAVRRQLVADMALRRLRRLVDHPLNTRAFREELMLVMQAAKAASPGGFR